MASERAWVVEVQHSEWSHWQADAIYPDEDSADFTKERRERDAGNHWRYRVRAYEPVPARRASKKEAKRNG